MPQILFFFITIFILKLLFYGYPHFQAHAHIISSWLHIPVNIHIAGLYPHFSNFRISHLHKLHHVYIYIHTYICIYIYIYVYKCIYIYISPLELVDIPNPNLRLQLHYGQRRSDPRPNPVAALGFAQRRGLGHWTSRISPKWLWFNKQHMVYKWYKNGIIHDRWYINGLFVHQNGIKNHNNYIYTPKST